MGKVVGRTGAEHRASVRTEPSAGAGSRSQERPRGSLIHVLLVEDNEDDAILVRRALGPGVPARGFAVTHVETLSAAADALADASFDVLLLDLSLPDAGGRETIRRGLEIAGSLPVLVLTGFEDDGLALEAVQRGAQDYVIKGASEPGVLPRAILQALERHRAVSELRASNEAFREKAYRDPLTGLFNREYFLETLGQDVAIARRYGQTMALLFMDLDNFKEVNDTLGHQAGDRLLTRTASLLRATVRESDSLCRYAGDEFIVLLREVADPQHALTVANKILRGLRKPVGVGSRAVTPGGSIGIAVFPDDGDTVAALMRNADSAMYAAKEKGNAALFYAEAGDSMAPSRLDGPYRRMSTGLQNGEFQVFYQPVVNGVTGAVVGAEALARWAHPRRGILLPRSFLEDLTAFGLLTDLSERVLAAAAFQFGKWAGGDGGDLQRLSVNLSPGQVTDADFPRRLMLILSHAALSPERLEVEIPELPVEAEGGAEARVVEALRDMGVRVILDGLGVESSTLFRLRRMTVDGLKLDRTLVQNACHLDADRAILLALVRMAEELDLQVTAEGVEIPEQRDFLLGIGCHRMQGFLFGRAVPAADFRLGDA